MATEQLSENRKMTKAMAAIERRFSETQMRTAAITYDEFIAISNYIETLQDDLVRANDKLSGNPEGVFDECPGCGGVADNGYDRSWPEPNPYYCTKCQEDDLK